MRKNPPMSFRPMLLAALTLLPLAGCEAQPPAPTPTMAARTEPALPTGRWDSKPDGPAWTRFALAGIDAHGQGLLATQPADVASYCPRYPQAGPADRRAFWAGLMSALARPESNFNPAVTFTESFPDSSGRPVVSRGLLQISQESANGYGCGITDPQQLHDPETHLSCAARIINRLVTRDGVIGSTSAPWKGMSAYWSPFRRADARAELQQWTARQSYCRP